MYRIIPCIIYLWDLILEVIPRRKIINERWRRVEDLNLRSSYDDNGFRDRRIQPLCQLSKVYFLKKINIRIG